MTPAQLKAAWVTARAVLYIAAVVVFCALAFWTIQIAQSRAKELAALRVYKASIELRDQLMAKDRAAFEKAKAEAAAEQHAHDDIVIRHYSNTEQAAHEDSATSDFLYGDIPQRLLDADAAARAAGGVGGGGGKGQ